MLTQVVKNWDLELYPAVSVTFTFQYIHLLERVKKWVQSSKAVTRMNGKGIKDTCRGRGVVWKELRGGVRWAGWDGRWRHGCGQCTGWGLCGACRCHPGPCSHWLPSVAGTVSSLESLAHTKQWKGERAVSRASCERVEKPFPFL